MNVDGNIVSYMQDIFELLSCKTRLKIVLALNDRERSVNQLKSYLKISQSGISHQLAILWKHHLVSFRKNGRTRIYTLSDEHIEDMIRLLTIHAKE